MSKEHTQTPWAVYNGKGQQLILKDSRLIAFTGGNQDADLADAALIVRAVNSHEAFVSFAEKYLATWPAAGPEDELATMARAALALAKQEE